LVHLDSRCVVHLDVDATEATIDARSPGLLRYPLSVSSSATRGV